MLVALGRCNCRLRNPPECPDDFDEATYLSLYPDVAEVVKAGLFPSGYEHWKQFGEAEGRICRLNRSSPSIPADFDEDAYVAHYPDVAAAIDAGLYRVRLRSLETARQSRKTGKSRSTGGTGPRSGPARISTKTPI